MAAVKIEGVVTGPESEDQFTDAFIEFVEAHGWYFGGGTQEIKEENNKDE